MTQIIGSSSRLRVRASAGLHRGEGGLKICLRHKRGAGAGAAPTPRERAARERVAREREERVRPVAGHKRRRNAAHQGDGSARRPTVMKMFSGQPAVELTDCANGIRRSSGCLAGTDAGQAAPMEEQLDGLLSYLRLRPSLLAPCGVAGAPRYDPRYGDGPDVVRWRRWPPVRPKPYTGSVTLAPCRRGPQPPGWEALSDTDKCSEAVMAKTLSMSLGYRACGAWTECNSVIPLPGESRELPGKNLPEGHWILRLRPTSCGTGPVGGPRSGRHPR